MKNNKSSKITKEYNIDKLLSHPKKEVKKDYIKDIIKSIVYQFITLVFAFLSILCMKSQFIIMNVIGIFVLIFSLIISLFFIVFFIYGLYILYRLHKDYYVDDDIIESHKRQYNKLVEKEHTFVNKNDLSVVLPYMTLNADLNDDDILNKEPQFNKLNASFEYNNNYEPFYSIYNSLSATDKNRLMNNYEKSLLSNEKLKQLIDELLKIKQINHKQYILNALNDDLQPNHYDLQDHIIREAEKSKHMFKD